MFEIFKKYLLDRTYLVEEELRLIQSLSKQKVVDKQSYILREGEISDSIIFIARGILRLYKIDDNGNEHILRFANENHWLNDRESYLTGKPSHFNIDAIEASNVLIWEKRHFYNLMKEIPNLKDLMKSLSTKKQIANQNRIYTSISRSVEERYNRFVENYPEVFNRVPLYMVASYLGVSRETLSRIRKRKAEK